MPDFNERLREMAQRAAKLIGVMPEDKQLQVAAEIQKAKNNATMYAAPKALWLQAHVPGAEQAAQALEASQPLEEPEPRQPIQMQREFSNDEEKAAYLDRIRQAQRNAAK